MKNKSVILGIIAFVLLVTSFGCRDLHNTANSDTSLRLNDIQIIGSHNSYKKAIDPSLLDILLESDPEAAGLDYHHFPIQKQLDMGLRSLELDVIHDPKGGQYAFPKGLERLTLAGLPKTPYDTSHMTSPGFKTLHIPDIDFRSHCQTFKNCLQTIKQWSVNNKNHIPIIITINPKGSGVEKEGFTEVIQFDKEAWNLFDEELLEVFSINDLIIPALVKGDHSTLREAIIKNGWPLLEAVKGKVMFVLDANEELTDQYLQANNYKRPMFVNVENSNDHAAFLIKNDPIKMKDEIIELVKDGFMVRTRSDANTVEARNVDYTRFEAAQASGAQVISTDYYQKSLSPNNDFEIIFDNEEYERCNPVNRRGVQCNL